MSEWAAAVSSPRARRAVQLALGALWLLDGVQQAQPSMFRAESFGMMLRMGAAPPPAWLWDSESRIEPFVTTHAWGCNLACVVIQLAIGLGIWWRRSAKWALAASIGWALVVWLFGEAAGGLFGAGASALSGAPGAALLYALVAAIAWPERASNAVTRKRRRLLNEAAWTLLWLGTAALELEALNRSGSIVAAGLLGTAFDAPGAIAAIDRGLGGFVLGHGALFVALLGVTQVAAAVGVWWRRTRRAALVVAMLLGVVCGVGGEALGGLFSNGWSGVLESGSTDPGTGPLLLLLALSLWPLRVTPGVAGIETVTRGKTPEAIAA